MVLRTPEMVNGYREDGVPVIREENPGSEPEILCVTRIRDGRAQVSKFGLAKQSSSSGKVACDEKYRSETAMRRRRDMFRAVVAQTGAF